MAADPSAAEAPDLGSLVDRVPEGWTPVTYEGRRYGLSRTTRAGGRGVAVYAEELGGADVVSANVYRTSGGDRLRPCEMSAATVLAFLRRWAALPGTGCESGRMRDSLGYLDNTGRPDRLSGGVRMIPVSTPSGDFRVWTKRVGNNPRIRVLLLHGGPGATHEYLEPFDGWLPQEGIEYYFYDQLGSHYSDQPDDPALWAVDRFVDEVEQVRVALGLDRDSFFLYGQSWGGALAIEYALAHQEHLKGLVVSNMMASIPAYNAYAERVLMPPMDQSALAAIKRLEAEGRTDDPSYEALLMEHHYVHHVLRMPPEDWPEPVTRSFAHINPAIYVPMQGPSELGASGTLAEWDRSADLARITVPTLVMGARHDTMDPAYLEWMAQQLPAGRYHHCPDGSHLALVDDQETYVTGLVAFLREVDAAS